MKPMLAATIVDSSTLVYPLLASPKLDGVRALVINGTVFSRSLKPIPNIEVQRAFGKLEGYDGELIVGPAMARDCYRRTVSGVMAHTKPLSASLQFMVFDRFNVGGDFLIRLARVGDLHRLKHTVVHNEVDLLDYELEQLNMGYEGVILRSMTGAYKEGRSTLREQGMMKLKRFVDSDAIVIDMEELHSNQNPAKVDALGYTDRSSHKANMVPKDTLGALVCSWQGKMFNIGTGFTAAQRDEIWQGKDRYLGCLAKFKYLDIGMKDLPRHPVFLGWRDKRDT